MFLAVDGRFAGALAVADPSRPHARKVRTAAASTLGTNQDAILSAVRYMGLPRMISQMHPLMD